MVGELAPGSLVVVALRDSAKAPRHLAVTKGPTTGGGGHILLAMGADQEVAVRRQSIKMVLPSPGTDDDLVAAKSRYGFA
jgi:hypothetical protein